MKKFLFYSTVLCVALLTGCDKDNDSSILSKGDLVELLNGAVVVDNNPNVSIIDVNSFPDANIVASNVGIKAHSGILRSDINSERPMYNLRFIHTLTSPSIEVNGIETQASHVKIAEHTNTNGYVFVSYNHQHEPNVGGVVLFKYTFTGDRYKPVSLSAHAMLEFRDTQVQFQANALEYHNRKLYIAGAAEETGSFGFVDQHTPALLMVVDLDTDMKFSTSQDPRVIQLGSYQSTSIRYFNNRIYITTGDNKKNGRCETDGGLFVFDVNNLPADKQAAKPVVVLDDASSVDVEASGVYVMQSLPMAKVTRLNHDGIINGSIYEGTDEMQKDAKSDIFAWNNYLFLALNKAGMEMVSKSDGSLVYGLNVPNSEFSPCPGNDIDCWFDEEDVTNSMSVNSDRKNVYDFDGNQSVIESDLLLVANGRQGLYCYEIVKNEDGAYVIAGNTAQRMFRGSASTNHVESKDNIVFVACGTEGLKVLYIDIEKEYRDSRIFSNPAFITSGEFATTLVTTGAALKDGNVWVWGYRDSGQQGRGNSSVSDNAVPARANIPVQHQGKIIALAGGAYQLLALADDGTLYGWGQNQYGSIGVGTSGDVVSTPTVVTTNVKQVAAGEYFSVALKNDGAVWTWGHGSFGQVGQGNLTEINHTPRQIYLGGEKARLIGGAYEGAFAVTEEGSVWAWGDNENGGLGIQYNALQRYISNPSRVAGLSGYAEKIVWIGGGDGWGQALLNDGSVIGWGRSASLGQGTNSTLGTHIVIQVLPNAANPNVWVKQLFARYIGSVALTDDGQIFTWGQTGGSSFPMIYQNTPTLRTPVSGSPVVEVGGGKEHVFYKTANGKLYGVGYNDLYKIDLNTCCAPNVDWPGTEIRHNTLGAFNNW